MQSMSCFTLINGFLLVLVAGNRWGYMLPRPPVIPEPEKIHWYGKSLKYFLLKHVFLLLGEHLHPSLEQSPLSGLEITVPAFCKKSDQNGWGNYSLMVANYILGECFQNGLEFALNLNINFPVFFFKMNFFYPIFLDLPHFFPVSAWCNCQSSGLISRSIYGYLYIHNSGRYSK